MKRFLYVIVLSFLALAAFAQTDPQEAVQAIADGLQSFTNAIAPSIPLNSTTGSAWSDAYIGQLLNMPPHVGVGAALGVTMIPGSYIEAMIQGISGGVSAEELELPDFLTTYGIPLPALVTTARVGGFILPFDVGLKYGALPGQLVSAVAAEGLDIDYLLVGGDVRYALLDEKKNIIDLSVGLGLHYLRTSISVPTGMGDTTYEFEVPDQDNSTIMVPHDITLTEPLLFLGWQSLAVDITAQVSKRIIFFTPYAGAGLTLGKPSVQTGIKSQLLYDGNEMTDAQMDTLTELYNMLQAAGFPMPIDPASLREGYIFESNITRGTDLRVYGGLSLDIFVVRLDLNALYSFIGRNWGGNLGVRIQL